MDLNYTDRTGKDAGAFLSYSLDMSYGDNDNNFELTIPGDDHCCLDKCYVYVDGEEYGGIVDKLGEDTGDDNVIYKGRTWHGILASHVVEPSGDYLYLSGDLNTCLAELITNVSLGDIFEASTEATIEVSHYKVERYTDCYSVMRKFLADNDHKLQIRWKNSKVELSAVPVMDYSTDEEFDESGVSFVSCENHAALNHVICLGQGELADRAVIHIFSDENGGIQPYTLSDKPKKNSDYITDKRNQKLFGVNEVCETLDYPSAEITTNYEVLTSKPKDWQKNIDKYFKKNSDGDYEACSSSVEEVYTVLTSKPASWTSRFGDYYRLSNGNYLPVDGDVTANYVQLTKKPRDWATEYDSYYYHFTDGVTWQWKTVPGISKKRYNMQTQKPTDWDSSYNHYYRKATSDELKKDSKTLYKTVSSVEKTVNGKKEKVAPAWAKRKYYTMETYYVTPAFVKGTHYMKDDIIVAPSFETNTYYSMSEETVYPTWKKNKYYREVYDYFAVMIETAIDRIQEAHQSDEVDLSLDEDDTTYDIGDITGLYSRRLNRRTVQTVCQIVVKINNGILTKEYEVR